MRSAWFPPVRLAPVLAVLFVPSCFSLPKVPVIRVVDDFAEDAGIADGGFAPTWTVFGPWTCGRHVDKGQAGQDGSQDGGQDAGRDGGPGPDVDAAEAVACTLGIGPGDTDPPVPAGTDTHALVATFDLTTPSNVEVVTRTKSPAVGDSADAVPPTTVNLTGFSQLTFQATLLPVTAVPLPTGTELHVELHCSSASDPLVDQEIGALSPGVVTWKTVTLPFTDFTLAAQREACLATVESIAFVVVPGYAPSGTKVSGKLQLDEIRLQ